VCRDTGCANASLKLQRDKVRQYQNKVREKVILTVSFNTFLIVSKRLRAMLCEPHKQSVLVWRYVGVHTKEA